MEKTRYLTKSRFKLALECPTKLYYTGKKQYMNRSLEDSFLKALAEGGFQVGELAKLYFPGGHEIKSLGYDDALQQTDNLLKNDSVTIYEAAIRADNLFIRTDILIKTGDRLDLIEVKAKSFDTSEESPFIAKNGSIRSSWEQYLYDVAFQRYVASKAFPGLRVHAYLMLADKNSLCPTDGLNQKFRIVKDAAGRKAASVSPGLTDQDLSTRILCQIDVDEICDQVIRSPIKRLGREMSFPDWVDYLAECYRIDTKIQPTLTSKCKGCEFVATEDEKSAGLKSGFHECWSEKLGWTDKDFKQALILDLWNYRKKDRLIADGCVRLSEIVEDDVSPKDDGKPGISSSQRQWLQVCKEREKDNSLWLDGDGLMRKMNTWNYPLHFIDFETTMVAIPFNKGRRPYEGVAFQFSHHTVNEHGEVAHVAEYLNTKPGEFPNYEFVRSLMATLCKDEGTIFRYSPHENTFLNMIYRQLSADVNDVPRREELLSFIRSITYSTKNAAEQWEGKRNMVDMWEMVKRYYYDPSTKGSNSIKCILPSILNRSEKLKEKFYRSDTFLCRSCRYKKVT